MTPPKEGGMKIVIFIFALVLALTAPAVADTNLTFPFAKPLCSFPFGKVAYNVIGDSGNPAPVTYSGSFFVQYDGRFYDDSYANQNSLPNGGIKFAVELGYYATPEERDGAVSQVINITFVNTNIGYTHIISKAGIYAFTDRFSNTSHVADYTLWLGTASTVIGDWKMYMVHKKGIYSADFKITSDMINLSPSPIPVELAITLNADRTSKVCFDKTAGATEYRVRIFDSQNNITDSKPVSIPTIPNRLCSPDFDLPRQSGRIEARLVSGYWITLIPCSTGGQNAFYSTMSSRANTYFTLP
jgi:hypothetical protein